MSSLKLSRSSWLYKFVFGEHEGWRLNGHPEPQNDRISLGLFVSLFIIMLIMRPIGFVFMTIMQVLVYLICFFVDGSYARGRFPDRLEIVPIKPWPEVAGYRFPPWTLLVIVFITSAYYQNGIGDAVEVALYCVGIGVLFYFTDRKSKSPAMELAEAIEPVITEKIRLSYYREPKLFPPLHLID